MQSSPGPNVIDGAAVAVFVILELALVAFFVGVYWAALWRIFTKAGQPGWAALVPLYNIYVLCKIVGRPTWWWVLILVPFAGAVVLILIYIDLARSFGKTAGFAVGLIFLYFVFFPMLAWGEAMYIGPAGPEGRIYAAPGYAGGVPPPRPDLPPAVPPPPAP